MALIFIILPLYFRWLFSLCAPPSSSSHQCLVLSTSSSDVCITLRKDLGSVWKGQEACPQFTVSRSFPLTPYSPSRYFSRMFSSEVMLTVLSVQCIFQALERGMSKSGSLSEGELLLSYPLKKNFFLTFIWLCQVFIAAHGIFSCGIQIL